MRGGSQGGTSMERVALSVVVPTSVPQVGTIATVVVLAFGLGALWCLCGEGGGLASEGAGMKPGD